MARKSFQHFLLLFDRYRFVSLYLKLRKQTEIQLERAGENNYFCGQSTAMYKSQYSTDITGFNNLLAKK